MLKIAVLMVALLFGGCMEVVEDDNEAKELDLELIKQNIILSADEKTAYVNVGNFGIYIIDISDTKKPKLLKRYKTNASVRSIAIAEDMLFCANDDKGVEIININDAYNLSRIGFIEIADTLTRSLSFNDDYSKLAVGTNKGVVLFDVTELSFPRYLGRYEQKASFYDVKFINDRQMLLAANFRYGLEVLDISTPSYPKRFSSFALEGNSCDIELDKTVQNAYLATLNTAVKSADISDMKRIKIKTLYDAHDVSMIWDISVGRNPVAKRLYLAKADRGFEIVDISDKNTPRRVALYDTNGTARGICVNDNESRLFVADGKEGFKIFDISNKRSPEKIATLPWF